MKKLCLHLGCGPDIIESTAHEQWINLDKYPRDNRVTQGDIGHLFDFADRTVDHIQSHYMLEHVDYTTEKYAWHEMSRVLKTGGTLKLRLPDIEWVLKAWLAAKDDWKGFYKITGDTTDPEYGFCNGPALDNRWGVMLTWLYGSQSQPGLFHINAYTEGKLKAILNHFNFSILKFDKIMDRDAQMLDVLAQKK